MAARLGVDYRRIGRRGVCAFLMVITLLPPMTAHAGRTTRFRVALAVLARRAAQAAKRPPSRRQQARLRSGLGLIGFLARASCARRRGRSGRRDAAFAALRPLWAAHQYRSLAMRLAALSARYPVNMAGLWPLPRDPARWARGRFLYRQLCASCHVAATPAGPIPNLFAMAQHDGPRLLMIRILGGVRGTRATALANPLSRAQIASLALYLTHPTAVLSRHTHP
ncbi:MAG: c-type cytochrome [Acidiferrobacter sp.]